MNYAFIKNNICVNITVFETKEDILEFKKIKTNDIDDIIELQDGFGIDDRYENGIWIKTIINKDLSKDKQNKINQSKQLLAEYLQNNPLLFADSKYYSVTAEKQNLLNNAIAVYQMKIQAGLDAELKWNATGEECTVWTFENLIVLALTIADYVAPLVSKQQIYEVQINACETQEELNAIEINYETV